MEAQLREWSARIGQWKAKADQAEAGAKIEYDKQINEVRAKVDAAEVKLHELKASSGDAWETLKGGVERAWTDLKTAVNGAQSFTSPRAGPRPRRRLKDG
ncbi:MAG: hypothetical protein Q7U39_01290 [Nitrospira sp.]|nr:hypothetical protein [Nitrospira sp.]